MPQNGDKEVLLGDVVISKAIVPYTFGRQYPDMFAQKDGMEDNLARPDKTFRNLLVMFETDEGSSWLQRRAAEILQELQARATEQEFDEKYVYPGAAEDKLFALNYRHKHQVSPTCICSVCETESDPICELAVRSSCSELGCGDAHLVPRQRLEKKRRHGLQKAQEPGVHIGLVGSGDAVIKSGNHRDSIAKPKGIVAFEMEGVGVAEEIPCVVIKGVCDYADCHKNKRWQNFSAATAAAAFKAVLERCPPTAGEHRESSFEQAIPSTHFIVPFSRNRGFVGREPILRKLLEIILQASIQTAARGLLSRVSEAWERPRLRSRLLFRSAPSILSVISSGFPRSTPSRSRTPIARLAANFGCETSMRLELM